MARFSRQHKCQHNFAECEDEKGNPVEVCILCGKGKDDKGGSRLSNQPTVVDGIRFASKREANRYGELAYLLKAGQISNLKLQVRYPLVVNGVHVCTYIADFVYDDKGQRIVEDAKGFATYHYKIKRALMKAVYGIDIRET